MKKIKKEEKIYLYAAYSKLLQGGRIHGATQTKYRILCSSWLLATFAAIGFLLSKDNILPFNHILGIVIISIIGVSGIYILWYADTFIEEMLLDINVVEGLRLEKEHPWLPQVHNSFLHLYKTTNARIVKVLYFIGCKTILIMIIAFSLLIYFYNTNLLASIFSFFTIFILNILSSKYMISKAGKIHDFMDFLWRVDEQR